MLTFMWTCDTRACYVTSWVGWGGWGMLTFMWTCDTRACYVTSWVGWGGGGEVNVHVNLRHTRMLRHVLGWVGWVGDVNGHVAVRAGWTATSILNWCEASGFGNGVGKAPKKMFWRKQVACCRSAWKAERGKKNPASFQRKNPCKLQANMLKPLDFPRENSMIFEMKINSFAMAKTTFFFKNPQNAGAVFPPTGCLWMLYEIFIMHLCIYIYIFTDNINI